MDTRQKYKIWNRCGLVFLEPKNIYADFYVTSNNCCIDIIPSSGYIPRLEDLHGNPVKRFGYYTINYMKENIEKIRNARKFR